MRRLSVALLAFASLGSAAWAQSVISAQSGTVQHVQGRVKLNDELLKIRSGQFPQVKEGQEIRSEDGLAEVLLNPGVFLRLGHDSAAQLVSSKLSDTQVRLLSGDSMIEVAELLKDNSITVLYKDAVLKLQKKGLYRVDASAGTVRVYEGEAKVAVAGKEATVKSGKQASLENEIQQAKFNRKQSDAFYEWNARRDSLLATANVAGAHSLYSTGTRWGSSGWLYNPYFGMFTYMPYGGVWASPFGYSYWSPRTVAYAYYPNYGYNGGYNGGGYNAANSQQPSLRSAGAGNSPSGFGGFSGGGRSAGGASAAPSMGGGGQGGGGATAGGGGRHGR